MSYAILASETLSSLTVSPSSRRLAFWATRASLESDQYLSRLMVMGQDGASCQAWTQMVGRPTGLVWGEDGALTYASGDAIWRATGPGEIQQVAKIEGRVTEVSLVPGSGDIVATISPKSQATSPVVFRGLPFKQDGHGLFKTESFLARISDGRLSEVLPADGRAWAPRVSPDGRDLAYVSRRSDEVLSVLDAELHVTPMDNWFPMASVRVPVPRLVVDMAWSPDSRQLAIVAREGTIGTPDPMHLWVWQKEDGAIRQLATEATLWSGHGATMFWTDGGQVVVGLDMEGRVGLIAIDREGRVAPLTDEEGIYSDAVWDQKSQTMFAIYQDATRLGEVVRLNQHGHDRLTEMNPMHFDPPEEFHIPGFQGDLVQTWLLPAQGPVRGTVLSIHGGPHGAFGRQVNPLHSRLAAEGFQVIFANPHGSIGYGTEFARALQGHWGEVDEEDWGAIVEHFEREGRLEHDKIAVLGSSYGGFMSTWLAGHWPFLRAAVIQAPVADQIGMHWTSDIGYTFTAEGVDVDFKDGERATQKLWNNSPLKWAQDVVAPVLLLHGADDDRCPLGQSEALFTALKQHGKEVEWVIYPGESHLLTTSGRPSTRVDRTERIVSWLATHFE